MTEYWIGLDGTLKLIIPAIIAFFYWVGGRDPIYPWMGKWIRRLIAPIPLVLYCWHFAGEVVIFSYALYCGAYWIGYGDDSKLMKWLKNGTLVRLVCGFLYGFAALGIFLGTYGIRSGVLYCIQILLATIMTVVYSKVLKIDAAQEENLICFTSCMLVPWFA